MSKGAKELKKVVRPKKVTTKEGELPITEPHEVVVTTCVVTHPTIVQVFQPLKMGQRVLITKPISTHGRTIPAGTNAVFCGAGNGKCKIAFREKIFFWVLREDIRPE